jgi:hypothetical protein
LVRLGGEDPRVWSPVPERLCTVVDPASVLRPVAGDAADGRLAPATATPRFLRSGRLVRISGVPKIRPTDYYVVLGQAVRALDAVKVVKLGGESGGRYWPKLPERLCTPVDLAAILIEPAAPTGSGERSP